jgi:hypothetical protein
MERERGLVRHYLKRKNAFCKEKQAGKRLKEKKY